MTPILTFTPAVADRVKRHAFGIVQGIACAIVWWLVDYYFFSDEHSMDYYVAVAVAYWYGYSRPGRRA